MVILLILVNLTVWTEIGSGKENPKEQVPVFYAAGDGSGQMMQAMEEEEWDSYEEEDPDRGMDGGDPDASLTQAGPDSCAQPEEDPDPSEPEWDPSEEMFPEPDPGDLPGFSEDAVQTSEPGSAQDKDPAAIQDGQTLEAGPGTDLQDGSGQDDSGQILPDSQDGSGQEASGQILPDGSGKPASGQEDRTGDGDSGVSGAEREGLDRSESTEKDRAGKGGDGSPDPAKDSGSDPAQGGPDRSDTDPEEAGGKADGIPGADQVILAGPVELNEDFSGGLILEEDHDPETGSVLQDQNKEAGKTLSGEKADPEEEYGYEGSMTLAELAALPQEEAGAATEIDPGRKLPAGKKGRMLLKGGPLWSCSDYYVNEADLHSVFKKDDFSLKYQIEFHTSTDLEAGNVEIRVPEALMCDRMGRQINPSQIGIPRGTPQNPAQSLNSPFNYFPDDQAGMLVFFNIRKISAGTNTAFQVLYHPVTILDLKDGSGWSLTPEIRVTLSDGTVREEDVDELTGSIDSNAQLLGASADALLDGSVSCLPALYTKDQVRRVLGMDLPSFFDGQEDQWLFVAWQIDTQGQYNQPWSLRVDAHPTAEGLVSEGDLRLIGSLTRLAGASGGSARQGRIVNCSMAEEGSQTLVLLDTEDLGQDGIHGMFALSTIAVTALRRDAVLENSTVLGLEVFLSLTPSDGMDPVSEASASASWTFVNYQWKYKGDDVGIGAWTGARSPDGSVSYDRKNESLSGWINEYRLSRETGSQAGTIPFRIRSECRGYSYTHETGGPGAGSYRDGCGYDVTTADDVVYLTALTSQEEPRMQLLGPQDYYYSDISVTIRDRGMDLFEDRVCAPMSDQQCPGADRSTQIYALYEDSTDWELVSSCPWNSTGKITYTFSEEQLQRKAWRVKVIHHAADYDSSCVIDSGLCLRQDSPVCGLLLSEGSDGDLAAFKVEHLGSVLAKSTGTSSEEWFHDMLEDENENYSEPGLGDLTRSLYGVISMRANSFAQLTELKRHARAVKTVLRENDPESGGVLLTVTIGCVEGYRVYSMEAARRLMKSGSLLPVPDRREYVFYDLLPEGVIYDPSAPLKTGLVMGDQDRSLTTPSLWKGRDVSVRIDPDTGIVNNWKNTGRTMVILHLSINLDPEQIPRMESGMWLNGAGVQFGCFCPYRDLKNLNAMPNIAAVMPGEGLDDPACRILGSDDETACDDGIVVPYTGEEAGALEAFGADIDSDGITQQRTVLYALALSEADTAVSLTDGIDLTVKPDREDFTSGDRSAVIGPGDPYTYRIDVTNTSAQPIFGLVVCNHLERAKEERAQAESGRIFDDATWNGFLESVDTKALARRGIDPVVWLNADRDALFPSEGHSPDSVLIPENGWIRQEDWTLEMGEALSVAVDLRKKTDGSSFSLEMGDSVHLFLHMNGPLIGEGDGKTLAEHAYHCASFYSISSDEPDGDLVQGNAVEVSLKERSVLIVEKVLRNHPAKEESDASFLFCLMRGQEPEALHRYRLEECSEDASGSSAWSSDNQLHTTGKDGTFFLMSGQRAVFENEPGADDLTAREILSATYEVSEKQEDTPEGEVCRFENTWHPPLYLTKKVFGLTDGGNPPEDVFRVRVTENGNSMQGRRYWTVDPDQGLVENQILAEHTVDEDSCVILHAGEVIALHPQEGCVYEAKEDEASFGELTDYAGVTTQKSGILGPEGSLVTLENAWRWKELVLKKEVLHKEAEKCTEPFTFRLWKVRSGMDLSSFDPENPSLTADPVPGVEGIMEEEEFVTDENGCFCLACAGKEVVLKHLEASCVYVIQETDLPDGYEAVDGGLAAAVMPLLGTRKYVSIRNSWKKRSLKVSKSVLSGVHRNRTTVFTPGYPDIVRTQSGLVPLISCAPEGMTGFTVEFPMQVNLIGDERIRVLSGSTEIDSFTGTIPAGTSMSYSGYSQVSLQLWGLTEHSKSGFFFYLCPVIAGDSDPGEDASERAFSFLLETADASGTYQARGNTPYITSDGEELMTDQDGYFTLTAGMSATFPDLGEEGCAWRVSETPDEFFAQVYPAGVQPHTGVLGEGGQDLSKALFINGEDCQGMFRKQFCAQSGDDAANRYLMEERSKGAASGLQCVFLIEVQNEQGEFQALNGPILVADDREGALLRSEVSDGLICVSEDQTVVLSGIAPGRLWRVTETEGALVRKDNAAYASVCVSPGEGRQLTGCASDDMTDALFVNEIHSVDLSQESLIRKEFLSGSAGWDRVPEGAVLSLCLERYESGTWHAASGVDWIQLRDNIPSGTRLNRTGEDGIIRVRKEASLETPILPIAVSDGSVRTDLYYMEHEAQEGDLRIREAMDLSDPSFGMLVSCEGNTFINENDLQTLVVEKQTDIETDCTFPIRLTQRIGDLFLPGRYLSYRIRDPESGEVTGSGTSDAQGVFFLRAGTQAVFQLAQGTQWEITEEQCGNWKLASCSMENSLTDPSLTPNGMQFEMLPVRHQVILTRDLMEEELRDPVTGQVIDFTSPNLRIPHYAKKGNEILEITKIGDSAFSGKSVRTVEIEDGIRMIGTKAFERYSALTSIRLPETLEEFGNSCFTSTRIASLEIPSSVRKTGTGITTSCLFLKKITIHQNEAESPFSGYRWNTHTSTSVVFTG